MGNQDEERTLRRFLKAFEQSVGATRLKIICRVDNNRAARTHGRACGEALLQLADLVDLDVARALERLSFRRILRFLIVLGRMRQVENVGVIACWLRHSGFGDQFSRRGQSEGGFSNTFAAGQNPAMMHPVAAKRTAPFAPRLLMADIVGGRQAHPPSPSSGAMARSTRSWTASGVPEASIRTKRSGSIAARSRKRWATRA